MITTESLAHTGADIFPFLIPALLLLLIAICVMLGAKAYRKKNAAKDLSEENSQSDTDHQPLADDVEQD